MSKSCQHGHKHTWQTWSRHRMRPRLEESSLFTSPILEARGRDMKEGKSDCGKKSQYVPQCLCLNRFGDINQHIQKLHGKDGRSEPCPGKPHLQVCLFHPLCHTSQSVPQSELPHGQHIWHPHGWNTGQPPMLLINRAPVPSLQKSELLSCSHKQGSPAVSSHSKEP